MILAEIATYYAGEEIPGITLRVVRKNQNINVSIVHFRYRGYRAMSDKDKIGFNPAQGLYDKYFAVVNGGNDAKILLSMSSINEWDFGRWDSSVTVAYYDNKDKLCTMGNVYTISRSVDIQHCYSGHWGRDRRQAFINIDSIQDLFKFILIENKEFPE